MNLLNIHYTVYNKGMNSGNFIQFTKSGYEKIKNEYEDLLKQRPDAVEHLKKAREMGDLKENGYYKASRSKLNSIDNRLFNLKILLKRARIIDNTSTELINLGCTVYLKQVDFEIHYQLVNKYEADPAIGKISDASPLGGALVGKKVGDKVIIKAPAGSITYTIIKIGS
jgi:transcription elongation factor GreA